MQPKIPNATFATRIKNCVIIQKRTPFVYLTKGVSFQLSVPCGTLSTPAVREAMQRIVKCLRA